MVQQPAGCWTKRAPDRISCGGIRANTDVVGSFLWSVSQLLEPSNPAARALLHASDIMGSYLDAEAVLAEVQRGVEQFNSVSTAIRAEMLMRPGAPARWAWDGISLSPRPESFWEVVD